MLELPGGGRGRATKASVRIASWNVEYLMTPATHLALRDNCAQNGGMVGGDDRTLPCAITKREPRTPDDYASAAQLRRASCAADIVALQEVDGPDAAEQVFPGYDFCFSTRAHTQKNGFAIRRGLPHRCEPEYEPLSLDNAVRRGVVVTFFPGHRQRVPADVRAPEVRLPGGSADRAEGRNCDLLSRQVAPLEAWIEGEANAGRRFGVLGDFNRRFTHREGPGARRRRPAAQRLRRDRRRRSGRVETHQHHRRARSSRRARRDSEYREYIDTILLGRDLAKSVLKKSFVRVVFNDQDAKAHWLSDHCPVGIELRSTLTSIHTSR